MIKMIGRDRLTMVAVGGLFEATFLTRLKVIITHQPGDPVASGDDTILHEIGVHAWAPISLPRQTKPLADMSKKHHVLALAFACRAVFPSEIAGGDGSPLLQGKSSKGVHRFEGGSKVVAVIRECHHIMDLCGLGWTFPDSECDALVPASLAGLKMFSFRSQGVIGDHLGLTGNMLISLNRSGW